MRAWVGISIATIAFGFQTMILYPWHKELKAEFKEMNAILQRWEKEDQEEKEEYWRKQEKKPATV